MGQYLAECSIVNLVLSCFNKVMIYGTCTHIHTHMHSHTHTYICMLYLTMCMFFEFLTIHTHIRSVGTYDPYTGV